MPTLTQHPWLSGLKTKASTNHGHLANIEGTHRYQFHMLLYKGSKYPIIRYLGVGY